MVIPDEALKPVVDPVCGMSVDAETTKIIATIEGQPYYFCAEGCRKAFEENPQKYLGAECAKPRGWWGRYMARLNKATGGKPMKCH
jgi:YHS domain-containing protein